MKKIILVLGIVVASLTAWANSAVEGSYSGIAVAGNGARVKMTLEVVQNPGNQEYIGELALSSGPDVIVMSLSTFAYSPQDGTFYGAGSTTLSDGTMRSITIDCSGAGTNTLSCITTSGSGNVGHAQLIRQ